MNQQICAAIAGHKLLRISYGGRIRAVEPYCHGFGEQRRELLRGFQVSGQSESGESKGWKFFFVERMERIEVLDERFTGEREGHERTSVEFIITECRIP